MIAASFASLPLLGKETPEMPSGRRDATRLESLALTSVMAMPPYTKCRVSIWSAMADLTSGEMECPVLVQTAWEVQSMYLWRGSKGGEGEN